MSKPEEILSLESTMLSIPGVSEVFVDKHHYTSEEFASEETTYFAMPGTGDLPIAMLRRSKGMLEKELLISVEFRISPDFKGLVALEFLSWWVRDASRSGENYQIRSIGLPPEISETIQLGQTLRFWLEAYITTEEEDIHQVLEKIGHLAKHLQSDVQNCPFEKAVRPTT